MRHPSPTSLGLTALAMALAAGAAQAQTAMPAPAPATGQAAPAAGGTAAATATPTPGATVYGAAGEVVGTVDSVTPQGVVINMGATKAAVPASAIGAGTKGLTVSLTREQLTAATAQAQAASAAAVAPGASVRSSDGATVVGTVKSVDDQFVTLTTAKGADVRLPKNGVAPGAGGGLVVGMTAAQFEAATAGAGGGAAGAASAGTSPRR